MQVDLREATFDAWLAFIFDHAPLPEDADDGEAKEWYWALDDEEIVVDPRRQITYLRQLFEQPAVLLERFSPAQIDQGFWCMFGGWGENLFNETFWNSAIPWLDRAAAIRAIERLYDALFGLHDVGSAGFMLWDMLAYDYYCGIRHPTENPEDTRVQQVMFETLQRMLTSPSERTQMAALHGLHHLMRPESLAAVGQFLAERRPSPEVATY